MEKKIPMTHSELIAARQSSSSQQDLLQSPSPTPISSRLQNNLMSSLQHPEPRRQMTYEEIMKARQNPRIQHLLPQQSSSWKNLFQPPPPPPTPIISEPDFTNLADLKNYKPEFFGEDKQTAIKDFTENPKKYFYDETEESRILQQLMDEIYNKFDAADGLLLMSKKRKAEGKKIKKKRKTKSRKPTKKSRKKRKSTRKK